MSDVVLKFAGADDGLAAQFRRALSQLDAFEKSAATVSRNVSGVFGGLQRVVGALSFGFAVKEILQFADGLQKVSAQTGISVESMQRLAFVASQTSGDMQSIATAVNKMQKALGAAGEESKDAAAALTRLGIPLAEFRTLSPDRQFERIAESIAAVQDPAERTALAIKLFGKSGAELLPILTQTGEQLGEIDARFASIGGPVSKQVVDRVDDIGDTLAATAIGAKSLGAELLALGGPAIIGALQFLNETLGGTRILLGGGDNESVKLDREIDALEAKAQLFEKDRSDSGQRRFRELRKEIDLLRERWNVLNGFGVPGISPRLQSVGVDQSLVNAPTFTAPTVIDPQAAAKAKAAAEESARIQRDVEAAQAQVEMEDFWNSRVVLQDLNQQHIDELLAQQGAYAVERVRIDTDMQALLAQARQQFGLEEINWEQIKAMSIYDIAGNLFSSLASQNAKFAKAQQAIALAQAIWYTASGVANALRSVPFPLNIAAAAKVAAVGAIQIAKIRATSFSGGGGAASGGIGIGGSGSTESNTPEPPAEATGAQQGHVTQVIFNGPVAGEQAFIELLRRASNNDVVIFGSASRQAQEIRGG